jgi:hypothetical protein
MAHGVYNPTNGYIYYGQVDIEFQNKKANSVSLLEEQDHYLLCRTIQKILPAPNRVKLSR